jgi:hypothetical protein
MRVWVDGCMRVWVDEWMDACVMDGSMDDARLSVYVVMHVCVGGWTNACMDGWMDGWVLHVCMCGWWMSRNPMECKGVPPHPRACMQCC